MAAARVKWTALPAGIETVEGATILRLAVLVSPEMVATTAAEASTRVALDPLFRRWPQTLAGLWFQVGFRSGAAFPATIQNLVDQNLWDRFLGDMTAIPRAATGPADQPQTQKVTGALQQSSNSDAAHSQLRDFYVGAAVASFRPPSGGVPPEAIQPAVQRRQVLPPVRHLRSTFGTLAPPPVQVASASFQAVPAQPQPAISKLVSFYDRGDTRPPAQNLFAAEVITDTSPDFHQWVSGLAQYPWLLRKLGLLLDLRLAWPAGLAESADELVSIVAPAPFNRPVIRTHCQLTKNPATFQPLIQNPASLPMGCLPLRAAPYSVVQVNVDGGSVKAQAFGRSVHQLPDDAFAVPPALRTAPFSVVKNNRVQDVADKLSEAQRMHSQMTANAPVDLYAEQLIRGYRIDVFDHETWYPLCERTCTLSDGGKDTVVVDEGWVELAASTQADKTYVHDALFTWGGWSLVGQRPGKTVGQDGEVISWLPPTPGKPRIMVKHGPTRYPAFRFNRENSFRARAVDLAGNPLAPRPGPDANSTIATVPLKAKRYEPIGAPFVVPRSDLSTSPGQSADTLVIRHGDHVETWDTAQRHIAPPAIDHLLAELHSLFDEHGAPSKSKYKDVVRAATPVALEKDINWFELGESLNVRYTVDPLCAGIVFLGLPNAPGPFPVTFDGNPHPFRIELVEGDKAPEWSRVRRVLKISMRKGQIAPVHISSTLRPKSLDLLGVWEWMQDPSHPELDSKALAGLIWAVTPPRDLTLMFAVQRPLQTPVPTATMAAQRKPGDTVVDLTGTITLDVPSSGEVELVSQYAEWIDATINPGPVQQKVESIAMPLIAVDPSMASPVAFGQAGERSLIGLVRQNFSDTHYRKVAYRARAISRFKEQFGFTRDQLAADPSLISEHTPDGNEKIGRTVVADQRAWLEVPSTARPDAPQIVCILPMYGWADPVHGKNRPEQSQSVSRSMIGGGLRVYLERGWYSSGDGEQLAVILWPGAADWLNQNNNEFPPDVRPYVSQWGMDPIWTSTDLDTLLTADHLLNKKSVSADLHTLGEFEIAGSPYPANRLMQAVVFDPKFDRTRQLWYCDIEMNDALTYTPFVRLALARFQPVSVSEKNASNVLVRDVHLSHAALADFVQFAPGRHATAVEYRNGERRLEVSLTGLSYTATAGGADHPTVQASLEMRDYDTALDWKPVPGKTVDLAYSQPVNSSTATWQGKIPLDHHIHHGHYRVVLREFVTLPQAGAGTASRLVYADVLEL